LGASACIIDGKRRPDASCCCFVDPAFAQAPSPPVKFTALATFWFAMATVMTRFAGSLRIGNHAIRAIRIVACAEKNGLRENLAKFFLVALKAVAGNG